MKDNNFSSALGVSEYNRAQDLEKEKKEKLHIENKEGIENIISCLNEQIIKQDKNIEILNKNAKSQKIVDIITIFLSVIAIFISIISFLK